MTIKKKILLPNQSLAALEEEQKEERHYPHFCAGVGYSATVFCSTFYNCKMMKYV